MTEVISIRFRNTGKVYYFDPNGLTVQPGDYVIVETSKGLEYGECTAGNHEVDDSAIVPPLRPAIRIATEDDKRIAAQNAEKEKKAFDICLQKIEAHGLDMKLVDVEYSFDGSKILFFFTSDGRVDFRELVKDLVSVFRARIELRQIGVRDGAKMMGGLGICGRVFCCSSFLDDFHPVSIKMAKTQSLSLNPTKISGTCGRLMCCLKYEQAAYEDLVKNAPKVSASVLTPLGQGTVVEVNLLKQIAKVRIDEGGSAGLCDIPFCDIGKTVSCAPVEEPEESVEIEPEEIYGFDKFVTLYEKPVTSEPAADKASNAENVQPQPKKKRKRPKAAPEPNQNSTSPAEAKTSGKKKNNNKHRKLGKSRAIGGEGREQGNSSPAPNLRPDGAPSGGKKPYKHRRRPKPKADE